MAPPMGGPQPGRPEPGARAERRARYAAEALRVVWRLSDGGRGRPCCGLAEPACSAAVFTEHLRWHAEGLERFLSGLPPTSPAGSGAGDAPGEAEPELPSGPAPRYDPIEQHQGVVGITLEAVGIQDLAGHPAEAPGQSPAAGAGGASALAAGRPCPARSR